MKRIVLAVIALSAFTGTAHADTAFTQTGTVIAGNPDSRQVVGATELLAPCGADVDPGLPGVNANGVDGVFFMLPIDPETEVTPLAGHHAMLTAPAPNDVDAWFYDAGCNLIKPVSDPNAYSMATNDPAPNGDEEGIIPAAAWWVVVDLYVGANAPFTFTVQGA